MPNININHRGVSRVRHCKVSDLKYKDYLEIDLCGFCYADVRRDFDESFSKFVEKAKKMDLPQIRIKFPYEWTDFQGRLKKSGCRPGLIFVEKDVSANAKLSNGLMTLKNAGASANTESPMHLVGHLTVLENIEAARDLLERQQCLHYKLDPVFFERPESFDMDGYLRQSQIIYKNGRGVTYGIYNGDRLVAFISLEVTTDGVYINELFTDDKYRGRGLGRILVHGGFSYTAELGLKKIWTTLAAQNQYASLFYESCGFRPASRLSYFDLS